MVMAEKNLKKKLLDKELTVGSWITQGHTGVAEIMARAGFDWLTVDMEHSAITLDLAQELIRVIDLAGNVPLVRVGENAPNLIKRVMDAGARGVIVPMVNTKAEAERAVSAVKYPPLGTRGVGLARAQGYGQAFEQYRNWVSAESVVVVQIEHIKAVENLEGILAVDGVDAFFVGPYDLSGSLGCPGEFGHKDVEAALKHVLEVSKKLGKIAGFHVIPPEAQALIEKAKAGYRFLGFSLDTLYLATACRDQLKMAKEGLK